MKPAGVGLFFVLAPLFGQTGTVTSVGYALPRPVTVAPGQVVTLFARTQGRPAAPIIAGAGTLPTSLGGFAVSLSQTSSSASIAAPMLSVSPAETCSGSGATCMKFTAISIQIPFELAPNVEGSRVPENFALLTVSENGIAGEPIALAPVSSSIHILNSCDMTLVPQSGPCDPVFEHADGSLVTTKHPANPGETLTIRAYGLGYADSSVVTGSESPSPAITVSGVSMALRYGSNLFLTPPDGDARTASAALVPGSIGVYRIPFQVPELPDSAPACSATTTNLTVVIGRGTSFDGVGLCVKPPDNP